MTQYALYNPLGYQQLSPAVATALTVPTGARGALIVVSVQNVRFRDDGVAPTAALGMLLIAGGQPFYYEGQLHAIQMIQTAATAVVDITYYGA